MGPPGRLRHGVFVDGNLGVFLANSFDFTGVNASKNAGAGFHLVSHAGHLEREGDASQGTMVNCMATANRGAGFHLKTSKGTFLGLVTNGNAVGVRVLSKHNQLGVYFEIANQQPDLEFTATSAGNVLWDLSNAGSSPAKIADAVTNNTWYMNGGWHTVRLAPHDAPPPCAAVPSGSSTSIRIRFRIRVRFQTS